MVFYFLPSCSVDKTILEADEDKDGKISYEEFVKLITNTEELGAKLTITL